MRINRRERRPPKRNQVSDKFYHSTAWRKKRVQILKRDDHTCQQCIRDKGYGTPARTVDHIRPIKQGGDPLADNNLEAICDHCHAVKSAKEKR